MTAQEIKDVARRAVRARIMPNIEEQVRYVEGRYVRLSYANLCDDPTHCRVVCVKYDGGWYRSADINDPESFVAYLVDSIYNLPHHTEKRALRQRLGKTSSMNWREV